MKTTKTCENVTLSLFGVNPPAIYIMWPSERGCSLEISHHNFIMHGNINALLFEILIIYSYKLSIGATVFFA